MKVKVLILIASLLILTGCTITKVDDMEIGEIIDVVFKEGNKDASINYKGYSYYLPIGIDKRSNNEYNEILYSDKNSYYFYVDIVSYYKKVESVYTINENAYYSLNISNEDDAGYIEINILDDGEYFIEIMYNYSKIEVVTEKKDINEVIIHSMLILNSIEYNDIIIDTLIGEKALLLDAEEFNIFKPKREEGNFLDYIDEYDKYEEPKEDESMITDDDELQINE